MASAKCPIVDTCNGKVIGRISKREFMAEGSKTVYDYQGIPFAKPPLGDLRFEPPQKANDWEGVYNATSMQPAPKQDDSEFETKFAGYLIFSENGFQDDLSAQSEDCLYLNVYTPDPSKTAQLPVMVWIYGGGFNFGGTSIYDGRQLAGLQDVVVVTITYRLSVLGFLSLGKGSKWPGNVGMLDQVMALEWIRDNIAGFGGNPGNVTILGESAGAISVSYHVLSPLSRGLFHRAISHSGSAYFPPFDNGENARKQFLQLVGITDKDDEDIMKKLKKMTWETMLPHINTLLKKQMLFWPVVDGYFIPEHPLEMMKKGNYNQVPYILGLNNSEGHGMLTHDFPMNMDANFCREVLKGMLAQHVQSEKIEVAVDLLLKEYTKGLDLQEESIWKRIVGDVMGDLLFSNPSVEMANNFSDAGNPTYMYYMTHQTSVFHHKENSCDAVIKKPYFCEADHGEDCSFLLGVPLVPKFDKDVKYSQTEKVLSRCWMTYMANFAKHGNPNIGKAVALEWPQFHWDSKAYLTMKYPFETGQHIHEEKRKFWNGVIKSL